jgi:hypothetical protein
MTGTSDVDLCTFMALPHLIRVSSKNEMCVR